jgi:hypothetical protein
MALNMKLLILVGLLVLVAPSVSSQEKDDWRLYKKSDSRYETVEAKGESVLLPEEKLRISKPGEIRYFQDSRISRLDSLKREYPTLPSGYRLQIFFGERSAAREKRAEFLREFPEVGAHISYLAPNFRLRVGDFRTRLECEKFKAEIGDRYPGSFIVKDKIELPELEE